MAERVGVKEITAALRAVAKEEKILVSAETEGNRFDFYAVKIIATEKQESSR